MAVARTRQAELQRIVRDRGRVLPFVSVATLELRSIGWYFRARAPRASCGCVICQAAREGSPAFIAAGSFLAAEVLSQYAAAHPAPAQEATG